jgi:hypothetical protein
MGPKPVTEATFNSAVEPAGKQRLPITAAVVYPDATLRQVTLSGDDSTQFAAIRRLVGAPVVAVDIDDQDGPAALGWVDDGTVGDHRLTPNVIASALADKSICGPMVITGRGRGNEALTSIHAGLQVVLEQMVRSGKPSIAS